MRKTTRSSPMLPALLCAAAVCVIGCARGPDAGMADERKMRDWVVVYCLSYDNDLASDAPSVLASLKAGITARGTAAAVLLDDRATNGLRRCVITADGCAEERLDTDDSASCLVLSNYVRWVFANLPSRHYIFTFADHGGRLDEMCLDEWANGRTGSNWLSAVSVGELLRGLRGEAPGGVELVFLQQCGRATIQNLHSLRGTGRYVLGSQMAVGAPNAYYAPVLERLGRMPGVTGLDVAQWITDCDDRYNNGASGISGGFSVDGWLEVGRIA